MADPKSPSIPAAPTRKPVARPGDPLDLSTSVAGEEDPGASFDAPPANEGRNQPAEDKPAAGKA